MSVLRLGQLPQLNGYHELTRMTFSIYFLDEWENRCLVLYNIGKFAEASKLKQTLSWEFLSQWQLATCFK